MRLLPDKSLMRCQPALARRTGGGATLYERTIKCVSITIATPT